MLATVPVLHAAAPVVSHATTSMVEAAYALRCAGADRAPADVVAHARRDGWSADADVAGHGQLVHDPSGAMTLRVTESDVSGERFVGCGIETDGDLTDIDTATTAALGMRPAFQGTGAATFLAVRENGTWRDPAGLDRAAFATAKAHGEVYSVMTHHDAARSALFSLNIQPSGTPR